MFKNIKTWEWVLIGITAIIILFSEKITEKWIEVQESGIQDKRKGGLFRRLLQTVLGELPFGGIINGIWDEIFPPNQGVE